MDLFAQAVNWKRYWSRHLLPYIGVRVLEVGAGIGTNTLMLASDRQESWVCLEPDRDLAASLERKIADLKSRPAQLQVLTGDTTSLPEEPAYDTILYIDVLEHIGPDHEEMERAYKMLAPGGHLIVLSPAYQYLHTTFDEGLGHFRRYSRQTLRAAGPREQDALRLFYLDSMGIFASLINRLVLKQKLPTLAQIQFWDRCLVRLSSVVDPLLGFHFGKTVVGICAKTGIERSVILSEAEGSVQPVPSLCALHPGSVGGRIILHGCEVIKRWTALVQAVAEPMHQRGEFV